MRMKSIEPHVGTQILQDLFFPVGQHKPGCWPTTRRTGRFYYCRVVGGGIEPCRHYRRRQEAHQPRSTSQFQYLLLLLLLLFAASENARLVGQQIAQVGGGKPHRQTRQAHIGGVVIDRLSSIQLNRYDGCCCVVIVVMWCGRRRRRCGDVPRKVPRLHLRLYSDKRRSCHCLYLSAGHRRIAGPRASLCCSARSYQQNERMRSICALLRREEELSQKSNSDGAPLRKRSAPLRKRSEPLRKRSEPLRKRSEPLRKRSAPLRKRSEPLRKRSAPLRKRSEPLRKRSAPLRKRSEPLRKRSAPLRKRSEPLRKRSAPLQKDSKLHQKIQNCLQLTANR